jgi:hypothetical protein
MSGVLGASMRLSRCAHIVKYTYPGGKPWLKSKEVFDSGGLRP